MAVRIKDFTIIDVAKPNLGEFRPSRVRADIRIDLVGCRPNIRAEWCALIRLYRSQNLLPCLCNG
jgi:intron-binding protein aquarius